MRKRHLFIYRILFFAFYVKFLGYSDSTNFSFMILAVSFAEILVLNLISLLAGLYNNLLSLLFLLILTSNGAFNST